jgi:hypothetical protein
MPALVGPLRAHHTCGPHFGCSSLVCKNSLARQTLRIGLLDHLIRPLQERLGDRQAEGFRGLEVDHQLELGWLLDG